MAEVENKSAETPQNEEKKVKGYKVTSGSFESKIEAAGKVREANNKGFSPALVVEKSKYKLLYAEETTKAAADRVLKAVKAAGLTAEICASK